MTGKSVGNSCNLLKIQEAEGRAGRKDVRNTEQVVLEGPELGKSA